MTDHFRKPGVLVGCRVERVVTYRVRRAVFHGMFAGSHLSGPVRVCVHPIPDEVRRLLTDVRQVLARVAELADADGTGTRGDRSR